MASKRGIESEWETFISVPITAAGIKIVDPMSWDGLDVALDAGTYEVRIRKIKYPQDTEPRVSRVQFVQGSDGKLGKAIGEIGVDAGTIGILDARALEPEVAAENSEYESELSEASQSTELIGSVHWGPGDEQVMVHVASGFGDGTYEVKEIVRGGKCTGIEIELIQADAPYPF